MEHISIKHHTYFSFFGIINGHSVIGEVKGGKVSGFHNWVQFYLLEKSGKLNYYSHSFNGPVSIHSSDLDTLDLFCDMCGTDFCLSPALSGLPTLTSWGCSSCGPDISSRSALLSLAAALNLTLPCTASATSLALENSEYTLGCFLF